MKNFIDLSKIKMSWSKTEIWFDEHVFDKDDREVVNHHHVTSGHKPHEDLVNALAALRKHVIEICELGPSTKPKAIEVQGISLSGLDTDDGSKVTIIARKRLKNNFIFAINTPNTTLIDEEKYPLAEDLDKKCAAVRKEAIAYRDGKHAPEPQIDMFEKKEELSGDMSVSESGVIVVGE